MRVVRSSAKAVHWHVAAALVALTIAVGAVDGRAIQPASDVIQTCSKTWVGSEPKYEEYLRTAPIDRVEDVGIGVTKPKRVYFRDEGLVKSAAFKPLKPGRYGGFWESYLSEIAAYEMDKLLGLHMVPPTVERRIEHDLGAVVMWVENVRGWKISQPVSGPDVAAWNRQVIAMKMFDNLIGNIDRNQGNLMYDPEYHLILIDHSRAFTSTKQLVATPGRVWRELYDRMNALTLEQLQAALGEYIGKGEIKAIISRRDKMREEVEKMVATRGERGVFIN